ncbi:MAG: hypothetical protein E7614_07760 [Ruminococcaceae bacterium]|nr:hypothetical protein [Oscillospiraceae bacterium]
MKNYFTILLIAGIAGSLASVISDGSPLGKYVKYISALICTVAVVSPLSDALKSITSGFKAEKDFDSYISQPQAEGSLTAIAIQITEKELCDEIEEKFGIIPIDVCIVIDIDGNVTATVKLSDEDSEHSETINKFLNTYTYGKLSYE